ncbi:MAG: DUF3134 domain-containing protein [Oculatellaceae cyanobacterium bins.114]|nr:DUF3134 domain-containing protein [Oculatellaceae cyanobacterium bins.114]
MENRALREEPRNQPARVIPPQRDASILDWLEGTGRLLARDTGDFDYRDDEEEINALMAGEDNSFEIDDDDDDEVLELDE